MTHLYHATPFDLSAQGFYFTDLEDYQSKAATHRNEFGQPVEEYELQYIDGDKASLFSALEIHQASLASWFEHFEPMEQDDTIRALWLAGSEGWAPEEVLERLEDVTLFEGSAEDYAASYLEDTGLLDQVPASLRFYIDIDGFARDMVLGGDIDTFEHDGKRYVIWHG